MRNDVGTLKVFFLQKLRDTDEYYWILLRYEKILGKCKGVKNCLKLILRCSCTKPAFSTQFFPKSTPDNISFKKTRARHMPPYYLSCDTNFHYVISLLFRAETLQGADRPALVSILNSEPAWHTLLFLWSCWSGASLILWHVTALALFYVVHISLLFYKTSKRVPRYG